ncbi:PA2778 family cysteine peptidase [Billgrantia gudaonensis]|uniref:Peptidase_C39 like family protein n=1 Tax=Billgrantia gudaonensis TaxID=376427 RepID=A0A1G8TCQ4_9GAMM|nr:PA2778 family cysteine peptidase [Halomonas gudaonensis]SDJ38695.1 Peptidase_C39 like family protein [Halomonas gudaonensis]
MRNRASHTQQNARLAGVLLFLVLSTLLGGCASAPRLSDDTAQTLPTRVLHDDVPFHGQRDYQCGPASLAMVLEHQGVEVSVDELIPQVFLPGREGSVQPEMLAAVRRQGRIPFVIDNRFESLLTELAEGDHPVVVLQNLSLPAWPLWHYAVVIGYDRQTGELILHSGEEPRRRESFRRFDATWSRSERWAFVALPPGELPSAIDAEAAIEATADFERVQGAETALPGWESIAERFPEAPMAHFALGNARYANDDAEGAIAAFRRAVARQDDLAVGWLNLGLALRERGDVAAARQALKRASEDDGPWQERAREALSSLETGVASD